MRSPSLSAALLVTLFAAPALAPAAGPPSPEVERIGKRSYIQIETPSFPKLPLQEKIVAYHLVQAAIQLDPIFYDQMSTYGLTAKRLLGALVERPERLPAESRAAIVEYAKLFLGN